MNRRIQNKISKKKNKERVQTILNEIGGKFTVEKESYRSGYFFFYMGQNSVCHFHLNETPDWKYAIWLSNEGFEVFGEHIDLIDKFKPSRTYVNCGSDVEDFLGKVEGIRMNPKLYFVDSLTYGDALDPYKKVQHGDDTWYTGYQVVRELNEETGVWDIYRRDESITQEAYVEEKYKDFFDSKKEQEENKREDRVYAFTFFKELPNLFEEVEAIGVIDGNKDGIRSSPRYTLRMLVNKEMSDERAEELFNDVDKIVDEKNYSKEKKTHEHQFSLYACYDSLKDMKVCDYQFYKTSK